MRRLRSRAVSDLADTIAGGGTTTGPDNRPSAGAVLRYGMVTAVGTGSNAGKAQVDVTGTYWNPTDANYTPRVGDLVYLFQQGPVSHVAGRIANTSAPLTPVGTIVAWAGANLPAEGGWLWCKGGTAPRTGDTAELYSVCGTAYGPGDGSTTFGLPDLTDRAPFGSGTLFARGEKGGSETKTLTVAQLPAHDHPHTHTVSNAGGTVTAATGTAVTAASSATATTSPSSGSTGSGSAINTMPPYQGVGGYIIRATR